MSKLEELWTRDEELEIEEAMLIERLAELHQSRNEICTQVFDMYRGLYDSYTHQHNLLNHLQGELERKKREASLRDVLDALLPIVATMINDAQELDAESLEAFKKETVPMWYESIEYALSRHGITLIRHGAGDEVPEYDEALEIRASATGDRSLDGKVKRSVKWGYSVDGEVKREVLYAWVYNPELDTTLSEKAPDEAANEKAATDTDSIAIDPPGEAVAEDSADGSSEE
jgi:hypothetical protein